MMKKNVIFDMDGVLFDTERLAIRCWDAIGPQCGLGPVGHMVYQTLGRTREESERIFRETYGERYDSAQFQRLYRAWLNDYYRTHPVPVKEGLYSLLDTLKDKGYRLAVASSSSREAVTHHLNNAGITGYFDSIVSGEMAARSKPEPDIYLAAAASLGAAPGDCYAVEDSRSGLWAAHRAGCFTVMIPDIWECDDETGIITDCVFRSLSDFETYIHTIHNAMTEAL